MNEPTTAASPERLSMIEQAANSLFILGLLVVFLGGGVGPFGNQALSIGSVLIALGVLGILGALIMRRETWHTITENLMIIGMMIGTIGMFQPNSVRLHEYGFYILALCTLGFIIILHVPKPQQA